MKSIVCNLISSVRKDGFSYLHGMWSVPHFNGCMEEEIIIRDMKVLSFTHRFASRCFVNFENWILQMLDMNRLRCFVSARLLQTCPGIWIQAENTVGCGVRLVYKHRA